ncbi:BZ3500_MvSof-1268-A1-R1_Chr12-3g04022 [Microbotryum saponariae]|uniref:BZ3500_MvSof-1268-A1-R1_Chr12-3g04022 protein n=1 Tax=Microbotryum saponariae TaxID=289078 RepID=A0A2X0NBI8_9BASI|nr:BZ3500_MvSof-1268-A1-R1_Chr12-3g04022 [Microbotryum saponariae]SDA02556.1 BZ3501_MvSof-1269-A2-R1_Chr12-3g03677 [Microbotryum saponariae]
MRLSLATLLPLLSFSTTTLCSAASLLAIDLGTDALKASLVKPGVPFDVLLTKEGRRKTPVVMTIRKGERSFGGEAVNLATRFPQDTFSSLKLVLGHPSSHPQSQLHSSLYDLPISTTARGSPSLSSSSGSFAIEELLAMQFTNTRELAEEVVGEFVKDVVVSVPAWWTQSERQAVVDALDLAGLRSIGLINDGTAAAVNYAMTRSFPSEPSYHLLYDLGAGSLRTTLVSLKSSLLPDPYSLASKPELKNVTSLTVHGVGFDVHVGGYVFDKIVRDLMVEEFEKNGAGSKLDKRAMAKLLKEASKVKQVLSANTESTARIEGLIDDIDFRTLITRDQFEQRSQELLPRFTQPIQDALLSANITIPQLESVILIGGSSRVPMVQAAVAAFVGEDKIAKNVNADEAAVLGAALYGAGLTKGFRTKDIRVQDITPFGIDVTYPIDTKTNEQEPRIITTHLFPSGSKTSIKKTMTLKKTQDFALTFSYQSPSNEAWKECVPKDLFETSFKGIGEKTVNLTEEALKNVSVLVTIELDGSNMVRIDSATLKLGEETEEKEKDKEGINEKIKGLLSKFGSKKDKQEGGEEEGEQKDEEGGEKGEDEKDPLEGLDAERLDELLKMSMPPPKTNMSVRLTPTTVSLERVPMSAEEKKDARARMREMKLAETRKLQREEARNVLEAFLYKAKELITSPEFEGASQPHERKILEEKVASTNEWLWDEGDSAPTKDLKAKKAELDKLVKLVSNRITEAKCRPASIESLKGTLASVAPFVDAAKKNDSKAEVPKYTKEEMEGISKMAKDAEEWLAGSKKKQDALKKWDDAVLKCADMDRKVREIEIELTRLRRKKQPRKPRVVKKPEETKETEETKEETKGEAKKEPETGGEGAEHKKDEL